MDMFSPKFKSQRMVYSTCVSSVLRRTRIPKGIHPSPVGNEKPTVQSLGAKGPTPIDHGKDPGN